MRNAIVVGVDFGPGGEQALRQAAELAARTPGAELHVAHVIAAHGARPASHLDDLAEEVERARARLSGYVATRVRDLEGRVVGLHVRVGATAGALLQLAADLEADVIVVGGRPHGFARFFTSSIEQRLLRAARCAVLVARSKEYGAAERTPVVEPPCAACVATRRRTDGATWWCERHATHHVRAHTYSYARRYPFGDHDSEVVPTGADLER